MKKITITLIAVLLLAAVILVPTLATTPGSAAASGAAGTPGDTVVVTVSVEDFSDVLALSATFDVPDGLTLLDGKTQTKWLLQGALMSNLNVSRKTAVLTYEEAIDCSEKTDVLQFTFTIDEPAQGAALVEELVFSIDLKVRDSEEEDTPVSASATIQVSAPATGISLDKASLELDVSATRTGTLVAILTPAYTTDDVQWESDNEAVASVDESGKVYAGALGTAKITATAGGVSAVCEVTVTCSHANAEEILPNEPNCEQPGNNLYYVCGDCGQCLKEDGSVTTEDAEILPKLGHDATYHAEQKATCVATGKVAHWNCARCGNNYADEDCTQLLDTVVTEIDTNNHVGGTYVMDDQEESCYQDGYTGDTYCNSCDIMIIPGSVIEATGNHVAGTEWLADITHHWNACTTEGCEAQVNKAEHTFEWVVDEPATEDMTGLKHEECDCEYKRNENTVIDKLPHQHIGVTHYPAVTPTCTAEGNKEYWTCASSKCDGKYYKNEACTEEYTESVFLAIDPNNHVGGTEVRDTVKETCYTEGYSGDIYCLGCDNMIEPGYVIDPTGNHVAASGWQTSETQHWHNCTTNGCTAQVDLADHNYQWVVDEPATEYGPGVKHEECVCGLKRSQGTEIPKLDHVHKKITHHAAVAATCTQTGTVEYWTCGVDLCDGKLYGDADCQIQLDTIVEEINSNNHAGGTEVKDAVKETCYTEGYTGDTYCKGCGEMIAEGSVVNATGNHVADTVWHTDDENHWHVCTTAGCGAVVGKVAHNYQWKTDKEATEYVTGLKHEECSCGLKRSEDTVIPKLDHVHRDIAHHAAVAATCVKTGTVEYWTCGSDLCDGKYYGDAKCEKQLETIVESINSSNHAGKTYLKEEKAATCSEAGYSGDTYCSDCDAQIKKGAVVPATGNHTPGKDYVTNDKQHWKVCTHCEAVVGAANHNLSWIVDQKPTEEVAGKQHQQCSVCKYVCNEGTAIDKLPHQPAKVAGKENTCTEDGVAEHFFCSNCSRYYASEDGKVGAQIKAEDTVLKATGHSYAEEWSTDEQNHWHECHCGDKADVEAHIGELVGAVEATKNEAGYTGDTVCSVEGCGYEMSKGEVIPSKQDALLDNIQNAETGSTIQIVVPNDDGTVDAKIPVEVLESAKGKDVELVLDMGDYLWKISGEQIASIAAEALDMTVKLDQNNIPAEVVAKVAGEAPTQQLSFAHSGEFGFTAQLEVTMSKTYAGMNGAVYCYSANNELVLISSGQISAEGKLTVSVDKGADYVIVVTENETAGLSLVWWIVIGAAAAAVVVVVVVVAAKKKKTR